MVALNQTRNPPTSVADSAPQHRETPPDSNSFPTNRMRSLLRARSYDPHTAEFVSTDPLEYVDGMSLFRGYFQFFKTDSWGTAVTKQQCDQALADARQEFVDIFNHLNQTPGCSEPTMSCGFCASGGEFNPFDNTIEISEVAHG